jgi:hypothetical protein
MNTRGYKSVYDMSELLGGGAIAFPTDTSYSREEALAIEKRLHCVPYSSLRTSFYRIGI